MEEELEKQYNANFEEKKSALEEAIQRGKQEDIKELTPYLDRENDLRTEAKNLIALAGEEVEEDLELEDTDYVFFNFIRTQLPIGVLGLLLAVIFSAAMSLKN